MEYDSAIKKNEILPSVTTWVHLEGIVLSEVNQTEETSVIWSYLPVQSKKHNEQTSRTETHSQIQRIFWRLPEGGGWVDE